ncbi:MAG: DUF4097 family beta strand repeat-containing protein [Chloroflexota bacterium]
MKKGIVIVALGLALLCLCAAILGVLSFSIRAVGLGGFLPRPNLSITAEADEEKRLAVNGPTTLNIANTYGSVSITTTTGDEIIIAMHKVAYGRNEAEAQEALAAIDVRVTQNGSDVKVVFDYPERSHLRVQNSDNARVDFTIQVPVDTAVTAHSDLGDVNLAGTNGAANLSSDYGDIDIAQVMGELAANTGSGKIEAEDIRAGEAGITLKSDYGNVALTRADARNVDLFSGSGNLRLSEVQAGEKLNVESNYGDIDLAAGSASALTARTSSGKITLNELEVTGALSATSDYGNLELTDVQAASYDLNTSSGAVTLEGAGGAVKAHSGYGNIRITGGEQATLDLSTNSGTVEFTGTLGKGPHLLKSDYGSITLTIPAETALEIDLQTDYGSVKSAIPVTLSGDLDEKRWTGSINGGGESLTAETSSGDIRIETLNP